METPEQYTKTPEKIIVNPEIEYYVISLEHTGKKDKYITLWRPENRGYAYPLELSGRYNGYEAGYHNSEDNVPIPCVDIHPKFIIHDDLGRMCIKNCKASIEFIKLYIV